MCSVAEFKSGNTSQDGDLGCISTIATEERWRGCERWQSLVNVGKDREANKDKNEREQQAGPLTEPDEKAGDVDHVCGVPSGVVIHFILFAGLVPYDIEKDVDGRVGVLRSRTIPVAMAEMDECVRAASEQRLTELGP